MTPQCLTQRCQYKRGANVNVNAKYSIILRSKMGNSGPANSIPKNLNFLKLKTFVFYRILKTWLGGIFFYLKMSIC